MVLTEGEKGARAWRKARCQNREGYIAKVRRRGVGRLPRMFVVLGRKLILMKRRFREEGGLSLGHQHGDGGPIEIVQSHIAMVHMLCLDR